MAISSMLEDPAVKLERDFFRERDLRSGPSLGFSIDGCKLIIKRKIALIHYKKTMVSMSLCLEIDGCNCTHWLYPKEGPVGRLLLYRLGGARRGGQAPCFLSVASGSLILSTNLVKNAPSRPQILITYAGSATLFVFPVLVELVGATNLQMKYWWIFAMNMQMENQWIFR